MAPLAFMVPKADVIVTDRIDATQSGVVSNVPLGLAATAGTFSLVGDWLTRSYETVFSLPNDLRYHESGMLFGQYLVEASTRFEITDQRLAANLSELWQACVFYDILLGLYGWEDLFAAPQHPDVSVSGQMAGSDPHAGGTVAAARREDLLDGGLPEDHFALLGSEQALHRGVHVVNQVVDDLVPADLDALSVRLLRRARLRIGLEGDDDAV